MEPKPEKAFPLKKAYPFADQHGLRKMPAGFAKWILRGIARTHLAFVAAS